MSDPAAGLSVLHVVVRATDTNSQYNEHCLPVVHGRRITLCSLFPVAVDVPPELSFVEGDGTLLGCYRALQEALRARCYDVVHVHSAGGALLTLALYFRLRRSRRDLVLTLHNSWQNFRPRNRLILWLVLPLFPVVVCCGEAARASVPRLLRRGVRHLEVVPNGVDLERIDRVLSHHTYGETEAHEPGDGRTVLAVNRLIPVKDPDTVIEAFVLAASSRDVLVVVGDGELAPGLRGAVQSTTLESQIRFTGLVAREDVYREMRRAAVFVSASHGEGLPVSVLEAMACRCPVVLSDIPPHREIARHDAAVRLVSPGDVDGFADGIRRALRMPALERYLVGQQVRRVVEHHFSVTAMTEGYGRVYREVADQAAGGPVRGRTTSTGVRHRRAAPWVAAAVAGAAIGVWGVGSHGPAYRATTTLGVRTVAASDTPSATRGNTAVASGLADLARREVVLGPVSQQLSVPRWRSLPGKVHGRVSHDNPPVIEITASWSSATGAERLAGAVADRLVALTTDRATSSDDAGFAARELARLRADIAATQHRIDLALAQVRGSRAAAAAKDLVGLRTQLAELQATYRTMLDWRTQAQAPPGLTVIDDPHAAATAWPTSRLTLAGLGASAAIAMLLLLKLLALATRETEAPSGLRAADAARSARVQRIVAPGIRR